ncbi:MAG: antitoxin Xre-like helix-turn-helix domain-containing protein [Bauldia sp.]
MVAAPRIADALGLRAEAIPSPFDLIKRIEAGLPVAALNRISALVAPHDAQFKYRIVPKATYGRRKAALKLSFEEGTRLARLARVWELALDVWQTEKDARDFLFRPHPMLEDRAPIDLVIGSEIGGELVLDVLGGLKYGTAA